MHHNVWFTVLWFNSLVLFFPVSMFLLYRWPKLWHPLLAIFLGIITGILDSATDETQFIALLLLVFGLFLGFSQPKGAWQWALLLGVWVPAFALGRSILNDSMSTFSSEGVSSLLALIPAFIGTYAGVFIQTFVTRRQKLSTHKM